VFARSKTGFKDNVIYTNAPQSNGGLFVMSFDSPGLPQLTDNPDAPLLH
jgi:hypothetical protein